MQQPNPKNILRSLPYAYALHQFVLDEQGNPCDYIFVDLNHRFEEYTGLVGDKIIGKKVTEVIPGIQNDSFRWIEAYARVTYQGDQLEFEQYSEALKKWYRVTAYSPSEGFFITLFSDITDKKNLEFESLQTKKTIQRQAILLDIFNQEFPGQQKFLEYALQRALDFTDSQYGYIFLYDESLKEFNLNVFSSEVLKDSAVVDPKTRYKLSETGFWGEVVRQRKPIINNHFAAPHPLKRGQPEGHIVLKRFISVPVYIDRRIVAVVGLANKEEEYTDLDANQLILLMQSVWLINTQRYMKSALELQRQKSIAIMNNVPMLLSEFQEDTTLTFVNDAYCRYFSQSAEELIGHPFLECIPAEEHASILERIRNLSPSAPSVMYAHRTLHSGEIRWSEWQDVAVFDKDEKVISYYSIGNDITERKQKEEEMARTLTLMNAMFDGHAAPMFLINPKTGSIELCNLAAANFFRYTKSELCELRVNDLCSLNAEEVYDKLQAAFTAQQSYLTLPSRLKSGEIRMIDIFSSPILYSGSELLFSIVFDSTDREKAMEENAFLINHDFLTQAYNRHYIKNEYEKINKPENFPIAVITCDINGLKSINQKVGTQVGDSLLIQFARELQEIAGPRCLLSRIGGDEFAILLTSIAEVDVKNLAIRLEEESMPHAKKQFAELSSVDVSASFGYGLQLNQADTLYMLINEAEAFMLHRKNYANLSKQSKVIDAIMNALYEKSEREQRHSKRVSQISVLIAEAFDLPEYKINEIKTAGILHDIGKIGIDERILNKSATLSAQEWMIMKQHSLRSARILIGFEEYKDIVPMVRAHHERFDGNGYPDGLKGMEIPFESRIIAVADAFDAMTVKRPYRDAQSKKEAVKELIQCSGKQFDPEVVSVFVKRVAKQL